MIELYFAPNSRAVRPRWLLEEAEVPYALKTIDLQSNQQKTAEYLSLNPNGHVPTLVDGETILIETTAITMYIADKYIEKGFAPAFGSRLRASYYQWMLYASSIERHLKHFSILSASEDLEPTLERSRCESEKALLLSARVVSDRLKHGRYLLGHHLSAADITMFHWLRELRNMYGLLREFPRIEHYLSVLEARPARKRAEALSS